MIEESRCIKYNIRATRIIELAGEDHTRSRCRRAATAAGRRPLACARLAVAPAPATRPGPSAGADATRWAALAERPTPFFRRVAPTGGARPTAPPRPAHPGDAYRSDLPTRFLPSTRSRAEPPHPSVVRPSVRSL